MAHWFFELVNFGKELVSIAELDKAEENHMEREPMESQNPRLDQVGCFV